MKLTPRKHADILLGIFISTDILLIFLEAAADDPLGILEDGGEMIVLSGICWYVFRLLASENETELTANERAANR